MKKAWLGAILLSAMILGTGPSRAAVIAFYDFEENSGYSGTLVDISNLKNYSAALNMIKFGPGTPGTSGPTYSTDTPISGNGHAFGGRSLTFPVPQKAGAYVSPGANTKLERQTFTVEGWVKITSTGDWQTVFSYQPAGAFSARSGFALGVRPEGTAFFRVGPGVSWKYATGTTVLARHTWHHLAGTYSAGTMQVLVNGVQEGTQTNVPPISYTDHPELGGGPAPKTAYIGLEHNGDGTGPTSQAELVYFMREGGKVDRLRIHDRALNASELDYWRAKDSWEGNTLGITDAVPAPWTPLTVTGNTINCWGRQITVDNTQIASQITSQGSSLLYAPIKIWAVIGGQTINWTAGAVQFQNTAPGKVVYTTVGTSTGTTATLNTTVTVEYDGMMKVDCAIVPTAPITFTNLYLDIPLLPASAKYIMTARHVYEEYVQGLLGNEYTSRFHPYVWLADDTRGLCWFCETDDNWVPAGNTSAIQVIRDGSTSVTLRLNIIAASTTISQPSSLTFGLHPTPVKPMPASWRMNYRWLNTYCLDRYDLFPNPPGSWDLLWNNNLSINPSQKQADRANAVAYWPHPLSYKYFGFPEADNPDTTALLADFYHNKGIKLFPYVAANELFNKLPEYLTHREDWILAGDVTSDDVREFGSDAAINLISPLSVGWSDFFTFETCSFIGDFNFDGIFVDWAEACIDYWTTAGKTRWPLFADRELRKRMYVALKALNPNCRLIAHTSAGVVPWTASFYDAWAGGEEPDGFKGGANSGDAIDRFALDKFRAEYQPAKLGVPSLTHTFVYSGGSSYPGQAVAKPLTEAFLALTLIHDVGTFNLNADVDEGTLMRWWDLQDEFGMDDVSFHGYWDNCGGTVICANPNDKASMYIKRDLSKAMLIVSNLGPATVTDNLGIDLGSLQGGKIAGAAEVYNHDSISWTENGISVSIPGHSFRVVVLNLQAPSPATVQGTVVLQGYRGDNTTQMINVEFRSLTGGDNITRTAHLGANGTFRLDDVALGTYDVAVRGGNWLQAVVPNVTVGAGLTVLPAPIVLKGGDCNGDDRVTFEDFSMLQNNYGQRGDAGLSAASALTGNVGGCGPLATALMVLLGLAFRALAWGSEA